MTFSSLRRYLKKTDFNKRSTSLWSNEFIYFDTKCLKRILSECCQLARYAVNAVTMFSSCTESSLSVIHSLITAGCCSHRFSLLSSNAKREKLPKKPDRESEIDVRTSESVFSYGHQSIFRTFCLFYSWNSKLKTCG